MPAVFITANRQILAGMHNPKVPTPAFLCRILSHVGNRIASAGWRASYGAPGRANVLGCLTRDLGSAACFRRFQKPRVSWPGSRPGLYHRAELGVADPDDC